MPRKKKNISQGSSSKMSAAMEEAAKDERFSKVLQNPLYRRVPKKEKSVTIDKRFQSMFHDKKFKLKYHMDARGRPLHTTSNENLKRLYNLEDDTKEVTSDEEESNEKDEVKPEAVDSDEGESGTDESESEADEEVDGHFEEPDLKAKSVLTKSDRKKLHSQDIDYARGEGRFFSEESSSDDSDSSVDEELEEDVMHEWGELDRDAPRTEEATSRLALCNMDWDRISASDLMVLFHSFVPAGGVLKKVTIYPSEFGKQRLAEEELYGPKELIEDKVEEEDADDDGGDEEGKGFNMEKLRKYQLKRLKYYYAVLEFDCAETADVVYKECDGMEYESSATRVDLRFIPEDMVFDEEQKEYCDKLPDAEKYRPRFFTTKALQQFKVDLTWDETDPRRRELTSRMFNPKEKVDDEDIQAYLASSSSDSEPEATDRAGDEAEDAEDDKKDPILKYKALLQSIEDNEKKKKEKDVEMEITWGVGLKQKSEELVKKKLEEKAAEKMTPWEEMLAKRREKRRARKAEKKESEKKPGDSDSDGSSSSEADDESAEEEESGDQPFSDDDVDIDMNDPFFQEELKKSGFTKSKPKKEKTKIEEPDAKHAVKQAKKEAELELLLMDEKDEGKHHFSLKKIIDAEKEGSKKKKKKKKGKKVEDKSKFEDDFQINLQDERFGALFSSHKFNIDPSDPNFKKTKAMEALIQEKQKRRLEDGQKQKSTSLEPKDDDQTEEVTPAKKTKSELAFLVKSIKGKTEGLKHKKNVAFRPKS